MNIIQIQDRLKGVPDQELVDYVETPTGNVPTYLALGELQRRKDMRERYESQQAPESSVAEKLVDEVKPKGIAAMMPGMPAPTQGIGAPQPQPEMTPSMLASSGVGALPAGNVGQNFAGGGIVAFEEGGEVEDREGPVIYEDGSEGYIAGGLLGLGGRALTGARNLIFGKKGMKAIPAPTKEVSVLNKTTRVPMYGPGRPNIPATRGAIGVIKDYPKTSGVLGVAGAYYMLNDKGEKVTLTDDEAKMLIADVNTPTTIQTQKEEQVLSEYNPPKLDLTSQIVDDTEQYGRDKMEAYREFIGEDSVTPRLEKRLAGLEEGLAEQQDIAPYMALTEAGLAIAAGRSQDPITNIARGATQGMKSYADELKDIRAREKEMFDIDSEILKAKRAEQVAIGTKGYDSMEAAEARNRTAQLEMDKSAAAQYEAERDRQTKIEASKIASMGYTQGGYYGFKGQQAINKAILSDPEIQKIDAEIFSYKRSANLSQKDIDRINRLELLRQKRVNNITSMFTPTRESTTAPNPAGLLNFEGYSATQID